MNACGCLIGVALALAPIGVRASDRADLSVAGTIMPSSCEAFVRGGQLDLGVIHFADLNPDETQPTHLVDKENKLDILCNGPARFALGATDLSDGGGNGRNFFGLGLGSNDKSIGHITISERNDGFMADGKRAYLTATEDRELWFASSKSPIPFSQADYLLGLNKTEGSSAGPDFVRQASMWLFIPVTIAPKADLVPGDELVLAGNVLFEIKYL
nr:DUF1120 domain-containing protein [Luteibacter rhizovicinus]